MFRLLSQIRVAIRGLVKSPTFTFATAVTLAVGIGAVTIVFSIVNSTVLYPLHFPEPNRLVEIDRLVGGVPLRVSVPDFKEIEEEGRQFRAIGICHMSFDGTVPLGGTAVQVTVARVSASLFPTLGVAPVLGRTFARGQDLESNEAPLVLSNAFWRDHFGGRRTALGKAIELDKQVYSVIGVMPADFALPGVSADAWTLEPTASYSDESLRTALNSVVIARLRPDATIKEARASLDMVADHLGHRYPFDRGLEFKVVSLRDQALGVPANRALFILLGAIALLLLIACINVAYLVMNRNLRRQREFAMRKALGASRLQMLAVPLLESLLLSLLGGCGALGLVVIGMQTLRTIGPVAVLNWGGAAIDRWVLGFSFAICLGSGALIAIVSTFSVHSKAVIASLRADNVVDFRISNHGSRISIPAIFAGMQIAMGLVLLTQAGLMARTLSRMLSVNLGFDPSRLMVAKLSEALPAEQSPQREAAYERMIAAMRETPGVLSAALASSVPLIERVGGATFSLDLVAHRSNVRDLTSELRENLHAGREAGFLIVTPGYFSTLGIPILQGRDFTWEDTNKSAGVMIVNEAFVHRYWPGQDPIGRTINLNEGGCLCQVVGVVGDSREIRVDSAPTPQIYRPRLQEHGAGSPALFVRTAAAPSALVPVVFRRINSLSDNLSVSSITTMSAVVQRSLTEPRLRARLFGVFAALGVLLATIGTYGVMAGWVIQRTREFGIRLAFGACPGDVLALVIRQGLAIALSGITVGLAASIAASHLSMTIIYGVSPTDPATVIGASISMLIAVLLATYIPARRCTRLDPAAILRHE